MLRRLFSIDNNEHSFKLPFLRLLIGVSTLLLCGFRSRLFPIIETIPRLDIALTVLVILLCGPCILLIYTFIVSFGIAISHNRSLPKQTQKRFMGEIPLDWILWFLSEYDIAEIVADVNGQSVTLGVSAENEYSSKRFTNKEYYIGDEIFHTESEFALRLREIAPTETLTVLSIDDLLPTDDNFNFTKR